MATRREPEGRLLSIDDYARLPDDEGTWDELVRGRVVREPLPQPTHGAVMAHVGHMFQTFIDAKGLDVQCGMHAGFVLAETPATVRGPDVWLVRGNRRTSAVHPWYEGAPDLAVEVLSPSNRPREMNEKVRDYLAAGAAVVWVLDPQHRTVAVHRKDAPPRILAGVEEADGEEVLPGFRVSAEECFPAPERQ